MRVLLSEIAQQGLKPQKIGESFNKRLLEEVGKGNVGEVRRLLKNYRSIDIDVLHRAFILAASDGHVEVVKEFLAKDGIDVNAKGHNGDTALMWAARNGHVEVVNELLAKDGIDVNVENKYGDTALMWAANCKQVEVVKILVRYLDTMGTIEIVEE